MLPITASKVLIVEGVQEDPRMQDRLARLRPAVLCPDARTVGDDELNRIVTGELTDRPMHGMDADIHPIVIFNRFRLDDTEEQRKTRIERFPALNQFKFNGYGGFDWRDSGSPAWREQTGCVCQPAWQVHTLVGCHFRCAYCNFGHFLNIMMNVEEFVARLDGWLQDCPRQTLFQWDNYTDAVCFEPQYGGARLLVDYFARRPGKAMELYVGKSDQVDFLLDFDHRGHTVCCWSLAGRTQSRRLESQSATMEQRIEAMRKCQEAGYPVRARFSPIIPTADWRRENREMIETLFANVRPDMITMETIRFLDYRKMERFFDLSLLDEDFVRAMKEVQDRPVIHGAEVPEEFARTIYEFIFAELDRVSPRTVVAFCRERRSLWEHFAEPLARRGQHPDDYVCNCGPYSVPATVR